MAQKKTTALIGKEGSSEPKVTNSSSIKKIKQKRKAKINPNSLVTAILNKDIAALSKTITLIESESEKHSHLANSVIKQCLPHANNSIRIGITGVPGVGKSTFIEAFGKYLTAVGKRVAVLAIDPTSTISKGSILGDKTRMEKLVRDKNAYIRPSASGKSLGGVAKKTRESIILCEAAGFDVIIIETVGVGQSETTVHSMVDFFLLLKLAGAGDELQGIKRGIIEMADTIAINKADGDNLKQAQIAKSEFKKALSYCPHKPSNWQPKVLLCSALHYEGIDIIWNTILEYIKQTTQNKFLQNKRKEQNKFWLIQTIEEELKANFFKKPNIKKELENQLLLMENDQTTPFAAAYHLLNLI